MNRGYTQWIHFKSHLSGIGGSFSPSVKILDIGSGAGELVCAARDDGVDCYGIEVDVNNHQACIDNLSKKERSQYSSKFILYDGDSFPFSNGFFDAAISWYVLEHVKDVGILLRETTRTIKRNGIIYFKFQDPQICYEGHANIPMPPFLTRSGRRIWMDEFGVPEKTKSYLDNFVYDNTVQQISSILKFLGWRIIEESPMPVSLIGEHVEANTEHDIRLLANRVKKLWQDGVYPEHQYPYIKAIRT